MQPRRRCIGGDVGGGAIPLDLIDSIERHVESIAALIFDHRCFDSAFAEENLFDAAINPDSVLKMYDVIPGSERGETLDRSARRVSPCTTNSTLSPENLVVCENSQTLVVVEWRNDESAIQHADRKRRIRWTTPLGEKLVQSLRLTGIVAEDDRR